MVGDRGIFSLTNQLNKNGSTVTAHHDVCVKRVVSIWGSRKHRKNRNSICKDPKHSKESRSGNLRKEAAARSHSDEIRTAVFLDCFSNILQRVEESREYTTIPHTLDQDPIEQNPRSTEQRRTEQDWNSATVRVRAMGTKYRHEGSSYRRTLGTITHERLLVQKPSLFYYTDGSGIDGHVDASARSSEPKEESM